MWMFQVCFSLPFRLLKWHLVFCHKTLINMSVFKSYYPFTATVICGQTVLLLRCSSWDSIVTNRGGHVVYVYYVPSHECFRFPY